MAKTLRQREVVALESIARSLKKLTAPTVMVSNGRDRDFFGIHGKGDYSVPEILDDTIGTPRKRIFERLFGQGD